MFILCCLVYLTVAQVGQLPTSTKVPHGVMARALGYHANGVGSNPVRNFQSFIFSSTFF